MNKSNNFTFVIITCTTIGILLCIVPKPCEGLTCWKCTNQRNSKCSESTFSEDESITMLKFDCSLTFKKQPAFCSKTVIKNKNSTDVIRGCVSKGSSVVEGESCESTPTSQGSSVTCLCNGGDLCNGTAEKRNGFIPILIFFIFGFINTKVFMDHTSFIKI